MEKVHDLLQPPDSSRSSGAPKLRVCEACKHPQISKQEIPPMGCRCLITALAPYEGTPQRRACSFAI